MVDEGYINEAENHLYAMTDGVDMQKLQTALLFYAYLNEKEDDFLEAHRFSRAEIRMGIEDVLTRCGLSGITDIF